MSDLADMLKGLLDDPATADKLKSLVGGVGDSPDPAPTDGIDPAMMLKISKALSGMKNGGDDDRTRLLCDLKPYISPARARRVDEAVSMLKLLRLVDIFKDGMEDF